MAGARIVDRNTFKKAGDLGFLMIWPEEKYGGMGDEDFRYEQIIIEETARSGCKGWFNTLHIRSAACSPTRASTGSWRIAQR